ncbi:MAG: thioredoxin family protein [Gemmatirosa sp.]
MVQAEAAAVEPRLRVLQLDADANPAAMARLGVRGLPTMLVFRDGAPVARIVGAVSGATLRERLARVLEG